jgi:heme-degrading monooxygenase HmoA
MYVVVRKYTVAGSTEELMRRGKEEFVPIVMALPGFKAHHAVDCGGRGVMSISFWESKVDAMRSSEAAQEWISRSAVGLLPFPPDKLEGDTVLDIA